jgi:hypothetical protein
VDGVSGVVRHVREDEHGKDPDWDELSEFPPLAENIRCFLTARDRVQAAEEALSLALDDIHEGLKTNAEEMVQIGADFHNQHEANYSALEDDIQFHLMSNHKRGCEYEERVEETKRHMQGMFASLLARVCRGRT